eukprot:scaffold19105_cov44-Phaeocystis_antarctica.AAC.1
MTNETRDRASSPYITSTSSDAPAGGMARKATHNRYLGRRRSSQSDELTTNGGQARTPSDRIVDGRGTLNGSQIGLKSTSFVILRVVVSMERPHRPAVCPEVPLVRTPVWAVHEHPFRTIF